MPSNLLLQAHQRALKRLELKKDRRRKKKRKAARREEAAVQQQRAAEVELETERLPAEAQQQSLSPFSWNFFGSTEVQVSAIGRSPCHHHPGCCWPMYLRLGNIFIGLYLKLPWLTLALTLLLLIGRSGCPVTLAPLPCDCAMCSRSSVPQFENP